MSIPEDRIEGWISESAGWTWPNILNDTSDRTAQAANNIIGPIRDFGLTIESFAEESPEAKDWESKVYVLEKSKSRAFEKTIWKDILPITGEVILVLEDMMSTHTQIFICKQDEANRYMEWQSYWRNVHYFSQEHPNWFYHDWEEE